MSRETELQGCLDGILPADVRQTLVDEGMSKVEAINYYVNNEAIVDAVNSAISAMTVDTRVPAFVLKAAITRPTGTTQYAIGDIINTTGATGLVELDFSSLGGVAGQIVQLSKVLVESNYGNAGTLLSPIVQIFNFNLAAADMISGGGVADNAIFKPLATSVLATNKCKLLFNNISEANYTSVQNANTGFYGFKQTGIDDKIPLGTGGKLWLALIAGNAYTPADSEIFNVKVEGFIL